MIEVRKNEKLSGIEVIFDEKPNAKVRWALKEAGFRWHPYKRLWYAKETLGRLQVVEDITPACNASTL